MANGGRAETYAHWATAIVNPLALIVTVIALVMTSCNSNKQLELSSRQLEISAQAFQGSIFYQALKDSREVANAYHEGKAHEQDIFATMESIFLSLQIGNVRPEISHVFTADNCVVMSDDHMKNTWANENKARYIKEFSLYMDKIIKNEEGICGVKQ